IFFAVLLAITMNSLNEGVYDKMIENVVGFYTGYVQARVRHYGDEARIEVKADEVERLKSLALIWEARLLALGFEMVRVDEEGLVSGKLNRVIPDNG
ncbi:MAG: hypothetical protein AAGB46_04135, partial [Verrucomicrobiota bacterium]